MMNIFEKYVVTKSSFFGHYLCWHEYDELAFKWIQNV